LARNRRRLGKGCHRDDQTKSETSETYECGATPSDNGAISLDLRGSLFGSGDRGRAYDQPACKLPAHPRRSSAASTDTLRIARLGARDLSAPSRLDITLHLRC
jgi:hypothetical protein